MAVPAVLRALKGSSTAWHVRLSMPRHLGILDGHVERVSPGGLGQQAQALLGLTAIQHCNRALRA